MRDSSFHVVRFLKDSADSPQSLPPRVTGELVPARPPALPGHATSAPPAYPRPTSPRPAPAPPAPAAPAPTRQSRPSGPAPAYHPEARVSLLALIGVLWAPLFFIMLALSWVAATTPVRAADGSLPWWVTMLDYGIQPLGFTAPFATTVLGLLAINRIQRADGRLYGLSLALFDSLLYPLLLLDVLIFWIGFQIDAVLVSRAVLGPALSAVLFRQALPTAACVLGDYFLATRAWAAVQRPAATR